jgi:hypothetical protein
VSLLIFAYIHSSTPFRLDPSCPQKLVNRRHNMGLEASVFKTAPSQSQPQPQPQPSTQQEKTPKTGKSMKDSSREKEWKRVVADYTAQHLDPAYLITPARASTVQAAAEYGPGSSEQPCLMPGTHKHLGGAYDPTDGCIYGVPAHSKAVLCLYQDETDGSYKMTTIPLPEHIANVQYKWLRGIMAHGYLWAIPSWAGQVLCVDVDAFWGRREADGDIVKLLPLPAEHPEGMTWQWHGAGINHEKTAIYCIPANAKSVLKVDLTTKQTSLISIDVDDAQYPNFRMDLNNKWYGGIVGRDNAVYGVPYRSCAVLRIDCNTDTEASKSMARSTRIQATPIPSLSLIPILKMQAVIFAQNYQSREPSMIRMIGNDTSGWVETLVPMATCTAQHATHRPS